MRSLIWSPLARLQDPRAFSTASPTLIADEVGLVELLQAAPCLEQRLSLEMGSLDRFLFQLGLMLEPSLMGVNLVDIASTLWFEKWTVRHRDR